MTEPARSAVVADYDPTRDLATVLHGALRQGFWSPAVRGAIERLRHQLRLGDADLASDIEQSVRARLSLAGRRQAALENVAFLASLTDEQLREAWLIFAYENPDKAARLRALLTGEGEPRG